MNELSSKERTQAVIGPFVPIINKIYSETLAGLNAMLNAQPDAIHKRNKSGIINNIAMERAKKYLGNTSGIELKFQYSTIQIIFKSGTAPLVARFKKVNINNLSASSKTTRGLSISNQISLWDFDVTYIEFGYRLNEIGTDFEDIIVVCRIGNSVKWSFSILPRGAQSDGLTPRVEPVSPVISPQIKIKRKNGEG